MKNYIEREDGKIYWRKPVATIDIRNGTRRESIQLIPEEKIARFLMLTLRRHFRTARTLRNMIHNTFVIRLSDKDLRGVLRRMQIQGKPVVSTFYGFTLASKKRVEQQAKRMLRHGWAEIQYAKSLVDSRLFDRLVGQIKVKL